MKQAPLEHQSVSTGRHTVTLQKIAILIQEPQVSPTSSKLLNAFQENKPAGNKICLVNWLRYSTIKNFHLTLNNKYHNKTKWKAS
jgi:hypothetical protein